MFSGDSPLSTDAEAIVVGLCSGEDPPQDLPDQLRSLIGSRGVSATFKSLASTHAAGRWWVLIGLGDREELTPERARTAAALARARAKELSAASMCWQIPLGGENAAPAHRDAEQGDAEQGDAAHGGAAHGGAAKIAEAIVEGTILADYRFDRFKSSSSRGEPQPSQHQLERLILCGPNDLSEAIAQAATVAEAVNVARDLQNRPGNDLTPSALAEHARSLAARHPHLQVQVEGRAGIIARSMGAFSAVAQGSAQEPALITLRYEPPGLAAARQPLLAFVGKAVTFDSGGISLKPGAKMSEMKFDMSGGAAVLQALDAIAALDLPIRLLGVVGATENLPSGSAVKPGDIVTAANGKTIEINNTDAEGRLVLADCLCHAVDLGAEAIVDLATLTGAVLVALGSTYAGLISNDDELASQVAAAGERCGEIVWRLPMHEEYDEQIKGTYADLDNAPEARRAGTIIGGSFLASFVSQTPWAHLDIAGSAWDLGRAYAPKQASGYGVRLLVELARARCARKPTVTEKRGPR